ncbi:hypothetical protein NDU88_004773 [Pleurodeles waltl]|uniref:Uncharacterized protein n=1 Tax=Pleurodeles waltl TaxID=8319 RepID=A0AAV7PLV8_PLEWA|nr:hypothetical protein NDU88_004773 [Pleurodeles waltl]
MGECPKPKVPVPEVDSHSSGSEEEGRSPEEQKGKYISRDLLPDLVKHVKSNMGFPEEELPDTSSGALLRQFQSTVSVDVLIHPFIQEVVKREWRDPDKIILPCLVPKLYPLHDMHKVLLDSIPIDSFVASLEGRTSLAEDAVETFDASERYTEVPKKYLPQHSKLSFLSRDVDVTELADSFFSPVWMVKDCPTVNLNGDLASLA